MGPVFNRVCFAAWLFSLGLSPWSARADESIDSPSNQPAAEAASDVRGRVVMEADGKPVANAEVRLVTWNDNGTRYDVKKAKTDERGEFVFEKVAAGKHRLAAFFEDFASRQARYKGESVDLSNKEPVTLKLTKMPRVDVRVLSKADGTPIENALVHLTWTDTDHDHRTNNDGGVTLRTLTREVWRVEAKAEGFAEQEQDVNLTDSDAAKVTFELEPGGMVFGMIRDEARESMAGVGVSVASADREGASDYMTTGADGRFRFPFVALNEKLRLGAAKDDYLRFEEQFALTDASPVEREVNIVLKRRPRGGSVSGTVSDAAGQAIAGAEVTNHGRSSRDVRATTTDEHGKFTLDDLFEGSLGYELVVKAKGFAPRQLPFKPGTQEKPGEIAITLEKGHEIRARVVNEAGNPVVGAFVYYEVSRGSSMEINGRTTTDAEGNFEFDSLPEKPVFQIRADGYSEFGEAELQLDGNERVTVTLEPEGMIRGKVIDAETRKPVETFNVRITFSPDRKPGEPGHHLSGARATTRDGERYVNADGLFTMKDLVRKMPLQVTVAAEGYELGTYRRVVAESAAEAEVIEFPLLPIDASTLTTIRGRIVDSQGAGIAGAELRLIVTDARQPDRDRFPFNWQMIRSGQAGSVAEVSQFVSAVSDADGEFAFKKVRPGLDMEIAYWGEGVSQGRLDGIQRLSDDEREKLRIENVTPGVVRGTIDRQALPKVRKVTLFAKDGGRFSGDFSHHLNSDDKEYEIRNIPPGSYQLQVYGEAIRTGNEGFRSDVVQRHDVEVRSGEVVSFDLGGESKKSDDETKAAAESDRKKADAEAAKPEASDQGKAEKRLNSDELDAATSKAAKLQLTVVDDHDAPVPNAKVSVRTFTTGGKWPATSRFECDEQGKLSIELPKQTPRYFVAHVEKPGYAPFYASWEPQGTPPDPVPEKYTVRLDPGRLIGGVVQDEEGKPITGAKVSPRFNLKMREERTEPVGASTDIKTDGEGRWTYASFPIDVRQVAIGVTHPEYAAMRVSEPIVKLEINDGATPSAVIAMKRGIPLRGKVTDPDGKPIAGANVVYYQLSSGERPNADTDKDGSYRISNGVAGETFATASAQGWAPVIRSVRIEPEMGEEDFQLTKGQPLSVRVVDSDGKPLAGVSVSLWTWEDHRLYSTLPGGRGTTDDEGKWAWEHAPEGSIRFAISKDGFTYIREQELTPGDEQNLVMMTPEAASERRVLKVSGRVIDAKTKEPIPKFRVIPGDQRRGGTEISWHNFNSSESRNGEYRKDFTPNMSTSSKHALRIEADGYVPAISRVFSNDEEEVTIDFALETGKGFVVLTSDGKPAKDAEIGICTPGSGPFIDDGIISPNSTAERTSTNDEGRFSIAPREGAYGLVVLHETGAAFATPDDLRESNTIQLAPFARLEGTLRISGKPAANQLISVDDNEPGGTNNPTFHFSYKVTTDKDGNFVVERLLPARAQVFRVIRSDIGDGFSKMIPTHRATVQFVAGETADVDLTRNGRQIVGKLVVPERLVEQNDWRLATVTLRAPQVVLPPAPRPPFPKGIDFEKDRDAAMKWWNQWKETDEGLAFQAQMNVYQDKVRKLQAIPSPSYDAKIEADGSFAFEDIPPGNYQLQAAAQSRPANGPPGLGNNVIAELEQEVTIEAADADAVDGIDLGELKVQ